MNVIDKINHLESALYPFQKDVPGIQIIEVLVRDIKADVEFMQKQLDILKAIV